MSGTEEAEAAHSGELRAQVSDQDMAGLGISGFSSGLQREKVRPVLPSTPGQLQEAEFKKSRREGETATTRRESVCSGLGRRARQQQTWDQQAPGVGVRTQDSQDKRTKPKPAPSA